MLTRLRFRRDFRLVIRCLSDKPSDNDGKTTETKAKSQKVEKKSDPNTEKLQELLKSMLAEPTIKESEYKGMFVTAPDIPRRKKQRDEMEVKMEKIEQNISKAAGEVAQAMGGDVKQTEAELLSKVLGKINQTSTNLSDLLVGMKVDRTKDGDELAPRQETRGQQVKHLVTRSKDTLHTRYAQRFKEKSEIVQEHPKRPALPQPITVNIFSGEPLGIFKTRGTNNGTKLDVWESLNQRELTLATTQPPANYFQKMILWTEQGKIWKFPINNEQGLEEEQTVHFSEHIFLDSHLEGWCPRKGPIRHFMELVCVGLSKNAFYTAQEKKDHIMWYKDYFESKKDLLTEVGAWEPKAAGAEVAQS